MNIRTISLPGLSVTCVSMEKFKTVGISLRMIGAFAEQNLNERALLGSVLLGASKKYPNKQLLNRELDYLYSTELQTSTQKVGLQSVVSFDMLMVNPKYVHESEHLIFEGFELLSEIINRPKLRKATFLKHLVEEEIRLLKEDLEASYHDKTEYAFYLFKNKMFENEMFKFNPRGELDSLNAVNSDTLMTAYKDMMMNNEKEIYVIGDIDADKIIDIIKETFDFAPSSLQTNWIDDEFVEAKNPQTISEHGDLSQSRITIGYRSPILSNHEDSEAMALFNILFGESDQSVLFQTIREEHHLGYYISSNYIGNKGVLVIFAGVAKGDEDKTIQLIQTSLQQIQAKTLNEEALSLAKETLVNRIKRSSDSLSAIIGRHAMNMKLFGSPYDETEKIEKIMKVNLEDIFRVANTLTLDTIHVYQNQEEQR